MEKLFWLFKFSGRADRYQLLVVQIVICFTMVVFSFATSSLTDLGRQLILFPVGLFIGIAHFAIVVRRYHDIDRSGWFILTLPIPFVSLYTGIYFLYFVPGTEGRNRYGMPTNSIDLEGIDKN
jgi:uncharacterized membrane protein YhaH (DUF805 family)